MWLKIAVSSLAIVGKGSTQQTPAAHSPSRMASTFGTWMPSGKEAGHNEVSTCPRLPCFATDARSTTSALDESTRPATVAREPTYEGRRDPFGPDA